MGRVHAAQPSAAEGCKRKGHLATQGHHAISDECVIQREHSGAVPSVQGCGSVSGGSCKRESREWKTPEGAPPPLP